MALFEQVSKDIVAAMKAKDKVRLEALRNIKKVFLEAKTAPGAGDELADPDAMKLLRKLAKQGRDSAALYAGQGRQDLADAEMAQVEVIEGYLPQPLTAEEIDAEAIAVDLYEKYRDVIAEDVISYFLSEYGIPEPAAETSAPARESISAPVFSSEPAVAPGASQEDYNRAREEMRQRELEKLAAFIN